MSDIQLGALISAAASRDAVHVAVAPGVAAMHLRPGQRIVVATGDVTYAYATDGDSIGIVDPFLKEAVSMGQRFWIFMNPGTVTNLRHNWSHSAMHEETEEAEDDNDGDDSGECRGC